GAGVCAVFSPLAAAFLLAAPPRQIVERVDEVIVSLDGPPAVHNWIRRVVGAYESMSEGIHELHRLQPDFPVAGRCTVQKQNCTSLIATVETARELGLNSISFLAADLTSTAFNRPQAWSLDRQAGVGLTADEVGALEQEVEALIESGACSAF